MTYSGRKQREKNQQIIHRINRNEGGMGNRETISSCQWKTYEELGRYNFCLL